MTKMYHYTECGLDYIYLKDGFHYHETPYGKGVSFDDPDGLHDAIARTVLAMPRQLKGQEVRFLRSMLGVSQTSLATAIGTTRPSVARWEGDADKDIPGTADRALRMFYAFQVLGHKETNKLVNRLRELDEAEDTRAVFTDTEDGWKRAA